MSLLPSAKRLNAAGWMAVACALLSSLFFIPYFMVLGFTHPLFSAFLVTIQLLVAVTAIGAYVNLAFLLNGPYRFKRANLPIGLLIFSVAVGTLLSLFFHLPAILPALQISPMILIGLSSASGILAALIHVLLALALSPLWKVVPRLNGYSWALLCFGICSLLAAMGYWLPGLSRLIIPLTFIARFVTFCALAGVFFGTARMAKAGWSNALLAQAENANEST